jgi:rRNA pseudouridine-1189 N-methylase Emg1 (Nep1/Mra1 family)
MKYTICTKLNGDVACYEKGILIRNVLHRLCAKQQLRYRERHCGKIDQCLRLQLNTGINKKKLLFVFVATTT